jgi:multiple sugar transport system permease protein
MAEATAQRGLTTLFSLKDNVKRQRRFWGFVFALPVVLGTVVFNVWPAIYSFLLSLTDWDLIGSRNFIGLENFRYMFAEDDLFYTTLLNNAYFAFGSIPFAMAAGLGLALLVNRRVPGTNFFRTSYFIPVIASEVAVAMIWKWIYNGEFGLLNMFLGVFGVRGPEWLYNKVAAMPAVIIVSIWRSMGYNMILFLAGLQNIPGEYYEAARIDGAGGWACFKKITLPLLSPVTFFVSVISIINSFQVFGLLYVMTDGGPGYSTTVYVYYLYQNAFRLFKMGYASALAFFLFALIMLMTLFQWRMSKHWVHYSS